jgi:hypothetical protein
MGRVISAFSWDDTVIEDSQSNAKNTDNFLANIQITFWVSVRI